MREILQLLSITEALKEKYKLYNKQFTLDGKLVGDIGEVLAAEEYDLTLFKENTPIHDAAEKSTGRKVQIKASFKSNFYFPCGENRVPDYFLCVNINADGTLTEVFNGPGRFVLEKYIHKENRKPYKDSYYTLASTVLIRLNEEVPFKEKIQRIKS